MKEKTSVSAQKVGEITDLQELKKYACPKVGYLKEWYLKCLDCKEQKKCTAGKQAVALMEQETAFKAPNPRTQLREYIEYIFSQQDPVKQLMIDAGDVKPQSIYQKVNIWRKNYPDLQEKYHMIEKVRFFWSAPYNAMRVPDILKKLYPEETEEKKEEPEVSTCSGGVKLISWEEMERLENAAAARSTNNIPTAVFDPRKPETMFIAEQDSGDGTYTSLEDFLRENTAEETEEPVAKKTEPPREVQEERKKPHTEARAVAADCDSPDLTVMLGKLREKIREYEQKIQEANEQISAILTVQQLMKTGV